MDAGTESDEQERVYIAGSYEHPVREAPDCSTMQLHAEVANGALADAGLDKGEVDGYCTAGVPEYVFAISPLVMTDYLGLDVSFVDTTDTGGSAYVSHIMHGTNAIRNNDCDVVLVTLGGRPRSRNQATGTGARSIKKMQDSFERIYGTTIVSMYALAARRHMHEYGTTPEQFAAVREAASHHAQYNENALYQEPVDVDDVIESRLISEPLHLLDCCVISDGGGAVVLVSEEVQQKLNRMCIPILGTGEHIIHHDAGRIDVTRSAAKVSGKRAFAEAEVSPDDIDYASIYDSFTSLVVETIEDLGFCEKGDGGEFVENGALKAPDGKLPYNTDGGSLCSNHPGNRGGMTRVIEAVRQLRGEANPPVQLDEPELALVHGSGGYPSVRQAGATLVLGREGYVQ